MTMFNAPVDQLASRMLPQLAVKRERADLRQTLALVFGFVTLATLYSIDPLILAPAPLLLALYVLIARPFPDKQQTLLIGVILFVVFGALVLGIVKSSYHVCWL